MPTTPGDGPTAMLTSGRRPPPLLASGHLALDFLNTVAAPRGTPIDWIGSGRDLVDWLAGAGVLDSADAKRLAASLAVAQLDRVAREAVRLREWLRKIVTRIKQSGQRTLSTADIERLNGVLVRDGSYSRLETFPGHGQLRIVRRHSWRKADELLVPIAEAVADLVARGDFKHVRRCENPLCTLWFYDRTKGHRRRWCSQEVCGNRAKVAAFRVRKRMALRQPLRGSRQRSRTK